MGSGFLVGASFRRLVVESAEVWFCMTGSPSLQVDARKFRALSLMVREEAATTTTTGQPVPRFQHLQHLIYSLVSMLVIVPKSAQSPKLREREGRETPCHIQSLLLLPCIVQRSTLLHYQVTATITAIHLRLGVK